MSYADNKIQLPDGVSYKTVYEWDSYYTEKSNERAKKGFTFLTFDNIIFENEVWLNRDTDFGTSFDNCYFKNDVKITGKFEGRLSFRQCYVDGNFTTDHSSLHTPELLLNQISVKGKLSLVSSNIKSCFIIPVDVNEIELYSNKFEGMLIDGSEAKHSHINRLSIGHLDGDFTLKNVNITNLDVAGFGERGNVSIQNTKVNKINFYNYRNEGKLKLSNIQALEGKRPAIFSLIKSYMGKAEFYDIDIASFAEVNITDCYLVDCSFVNVKWKYIIRSWYGLYLIGDYPTVNETKTINKIIAIENKWWKSVAIKRKYRRENDVINYYIKNRETYRQLKFALSKQGDVINEQKFHAKEMIAYNSYLRWRGKDIGTKLIINLSSITSDFGQSIFRPLWTLIVAHTLLYLIAYNLGAITTNNFQDTVYTYFILINPLHSTEFSSTSGQWCDYEISLKGGFIIIDLLMRIVSSYMIYNIIRASRRFIK